MVDGKETTIKLHTGPEAHQFRDCIDIAVKLAFSMQHHKEDQVVIKPNQISNLKAVQELSNQDDINKLSKEKLVNTAFRIQQASESQIRAQVVIVSKKIDTRSKYLEQALEQCCTDKSKELAVEFKFNHLSIFDDCSYNDYRDQAQALTKLYNQANTDIFCNFSQANIIAPLGQTISFEGE